MLKQTVCCSISETGTGGVRIRTSVVTVTKPETGAGCVRIRAGVVVVTKIKTPTF